MGWCCARLKDYILNVVNRTAPVERDNTMKHDKTNMAEVLGYELWHHKLPVSARLAHGTEAHCLTILQMIRKDDWPDIYLQRPDGTDIPVTEVA